MLHSSYSAQESHYCGTQPSGFSKVGTFLLLKLLCSLDLYLFVMGNIHHKGPTDTVLQ